MGRICAVVLNSVSRDARVLKQAATLAEAGHQVMVIGVADAHHRELQTVLDNGVAITRVPPPPAIGNPNTPAANTVAIVGLLLLIPLLAYSYFYWPVREQLKLVYLLVGAFILLRLGRYSLRLWVSLAERSAKRHAAASGQGESLQSGSRLILATNWRLNRLRNRLRESLAYLAHRTAPGLVDTAYHRSRLRNELMVEAVCAFAPDVLHCHDVHMLSVGALVKKRIRCPVVYDAHEIYEEVAQGSEATARRYRQLHRQHTCIVDRFITINDSIAEWYAEHYPALPPATVIKNATKLVPPVAYDGRMHRAADLRKGAKVLLYQGGYATKRGLENLVRSAEFLPADWTLVMMGWGRLEDHLRGLAAEIEARADRDAPVRFIPPAPQAELANWTAGGTIGVIPYENIGLNHLYCTPNKLWEYPVAGVPVLISPLPEMIKPVTEYSYGWLLPADVPEPEEIARFIAGLSEEEIARAKAACRTFIEADNWDRYALRLLECYADLAVGRAQTADTANAA